jgi:outer membrane protein assembly factor BamB/beta-lactamase regulating signal transducer with metallopeptidase domain
MHAIFDSDFSVRLTLAILHFIWQGLAIALVVWIASACLRRAPARARYVANLAALAAIAACLPVTYLALGTWPAPHRLEVGVASDGGAVEEGAIGNARPASESLAFLPGTTAVPAPALPPTVGHASSTRQPWDVARSVVPPAAPDRSLSVWLETVAPYATVAYFLGVLAMLIRLAAALWGGQRLRAASQPVTDASVREIVHRVALRVGLKTAPAVAFCQRVSGPVVVGLVRPLILLPGALASGLAPDQIEALLTHELAHIRRHDLWVNLLQRLVEATFFFHPAVWYVSRRVSTERENCCDDFVLSAGWPRVHYADALVRMAELCLASRGARIVDRALGPQPTLLAASGDRPSQFKRRVLRILGQEPTPALMLNRAGVLGLMVVAAMLMAAPLLVRAFAAPPDEPSAGTNDTSLAAAAPPRDAWPQWGGSPRRNHASSATGLPVSWDVAKKANLKWIAPLGTATYSSPIVAGNKVLIGTNNAAGRVARFPKSVDVSCLQCFDRATGRFLWQYSSEKLPGGRVNDWPQCGICSSPCVEGDRLWLMTNRCEVVCLDLSGFRDGANDGPFEGEVAKADDEADVVWRSDLMKVLGVRPFCQAASSVTLAGELVLVNTSNGTDESHDKIPAPDAPSFVALDRRSGRVVWSDASPGANLLPTCPSSSPAVAELGGVWQAIFAGSDGWLYSFDLADVRRGKTTLLWKFDCNPKTSRWQLGGKGDRNTLIASPVIYDGRVYVVTGRSPEEADGPGQLWCVDPTKRGDTSSELVFNRADPAKPIDHKRLQACDTTAGDFTRANTSSGMVWRYESFDYNGNGRHEFSETMHRSIGSVSLAGGLAVVADLSGILHCLDARTGKPYWSHDLQAAVWSTPLLADGRIYIADEDGDVAVFSLAKKKVLLAEFSVEGPVYGSFAAADGSLFLPTARQLLAIAQPAADKPAADNRGADWPLFRRGADARGMASGELLEKPELLWKKVLGVVGGAGGDGAGGDGADRGDIAERDSFNATAAIAGGMVYLGGREGTLYALDLATGDERWRFKNANGFSAPASVRGGLLYLGDLDGKLLCLNSATGALKWTFAAEGPIENGANIYRDSVIFGSQDASLYCLDAATGRLIWKLVTDDQIRSFPTIAGDRIFVAGCDGKLHVVDAATGKPLAAVPLDGPTGCTPAVRGDRVFVGTEEGKFLGIDWRHAKRAWTYQHPDRKAGYRSSPALTDDVVVVASRGKYVAGLHPATGEQLWTLNTATAIDGSPVIAAGRAYFGSSRGRLHALDIKTGKQVWEYVAGGGFQASPAVAGGRLVIASEDGVVYCFGAKGPGR